MHGRPRETPRPTQPDATFDWNLPWTTLSLATTIFRNTCKVVHLPHALSSALTSVGITVMEDDLEVRLMAVHEARLIPDYFHTSTPEHLNNLGVDPTRLPDLGIWERRITQEMGVPVERRSNVALVWLQYDRPIGFSTADRITFGKRANMHLHIFYMSLRNKGVGTRCVRKSVDIYFDVLQLDELFCEPHAFNVAPNRTLQNAGFRYVKTHRTVPGPLNFHQAVNQWHIERSTANICDPKGSEGNC